MYRQQRSVLKVRPYRPRLEILEDRNLLSTFTVDRLTDDTVGDGLNGSLRYCITNATDGDDIQFGVAGTINLTGPLPNLTHSISIEGPEADQLTVRGAGYFRIFTVAAGTSVLLFGLTITNGWVVEDRGGGILNWGTLTLGNSSLSGNKADGMYKQGYGGGVYNGGSLTVNNTTVSGNLVNGGDKDGGGNGGGIFNSGTLTLSNSTISGNSAYGGGGGIFNLNGTLTVSNSTISGNQADSGGGIANGGTLTVSNSTISGNQADSGGGIANGGTLTVSNSTLSGNSAYYSGGGIGTSGTQPVRLTNVTLTANRANTGGGSYFFGGGLFVYTGSPVLHNTLIAGNFNGATGTTRDDVLGALDSSGDYNLIGDGTGMTGLTDGGNGNQVGTADNPIDPLLGPLDDNGGPTLTHALLPGSPAIDAGDNTDAPDWDQRGEGFLRVVGILDPDNPVIDIGAFEVQAEGSGSRSRQFARNHTTSAMEDLPQLALTTQEVYVPWADRPAVADITSRTVSLPEDAATPQHHTLVVAVGPLSSAVSAPGKLVHRDLLDLAFAGLEAGSLRDELARERTALL